uniref:ABC transporter permease n=1 Tax=Marinobacterium profundum TaxID=1714300 RepID=UPI00082DD65A|nr:ABC transporter permease [Marinobacterium profundum]
MTISARTLGAIEALFIPLLAILISMILFAVFVWIAGSSPADVFALMYKGAFGTSFSIENTLQRAAPLILAALCTALPAHLGMVIIGGEGALVIGGLSAAGIALTLPSGSSPLMIQTVMILSGMLMGGLWIGASGFLRHVRGVNETISSLLLSYIAIAILNHMVSGPLRDPSSLNKPSTRPIGDENMIGSIPGMDVHWGLVMGIIFCACAYVLMYRTTFGFSARMVGGNVRAAAMSGLPVGRLLVITCVIAGAAAGLAGAVEVAAVHGAANAPFAAGYGYTGILIAFLARQNPLAIIPVAILMAGIDASGGLLQRRLDLPDATVYVLQGIIFIVILACETLFGRFNIFQPKETA